MRSVFISSTFKDMQSERDLLHEQIFPRLRRVMAEYGEDIQELDLRWGVDTANMTEEESGHAVLKVCIDAIDRCKPFFIVLLGERYGWIPGQEIVLSVGDARIDPYYETDMSITNLEICYGALAREELLERSVFCFRDPSLNDRIEPEYRGIYDAESERHRERLAALKGTILARGKGEIIRYQADWDPERHRVTDLAAFGEQVYQILARMIRKEFAGQQPAGTEEALLRQMAQTKERYLSSYISRPAEELAILEGCASFGMAQGAGPEPASKRGAAPKAASGTAGRTAQTGQYGLRFADRKRIVVQGEAGTGKSALMAACAQMLASQTNAGISCPDQAKPDMAGRAAVENDEAVGAAPDWHVILYFAGNPGCQAISVLKRVLIWRLEEILGEPHEGRGAGPEERLKFLDGKIAESQRIFCFLDAADQLSGEGSDVYLDVLQLCPHLFFVISVLSSFPFEEAVTGTGVSFDTVQIGGLKKRQIRQMIAATAKRRGKKLDDVVSRTVSEKKESANPLYLSMILQRFFMMDGAEFAAAEALAPGMEGLHRYMMGLLEQMPDDAPGMVRYLLKETAGHFGIRNFATIVSLLAEAREGLSEQELEGILADTAHPFSPVQFQQIVSYLYDSFAQRQDGKWSLSHRLFGEAVLEDVSASRGSEAEDKTVRPESDAAVQSSRAGVAASGSQPGAKELLIAYARKNQEFRQREGYYYLLAGKCPEGASILELAVIPGRADEAVTVGAESCRSGETAAFGAEAHRSGEAAARPEHYDTEELYRSIPLFLYRDPGYGQYLIRMVEQSGAPDRLAAFWSEKCFLSSSPAEYEVQHKIWDRLLEHPACSARGKLDCCKKYALSCRMEGDRAGEEHYLNRAVRLIEELPEEEKAYERVKHLADLGDRAGQAGDRKQAGELYRRALECTDAAERTDRTKLLRLQLLRTLYETGAQTADGVSGEELLLMASEEAAGCDCSSPKSVFTGEKIRILGQLTRLYVSKDKFDIEKAKACGEEGIALARSCVRQSPTLQYLFLLAQMLTDAASLKKPEYQYPYFEEALGCRKRILGNVVTTENQLLLACTHTWYAQSLDQAISAGVKNRSQNAGQLAKENWDAGFAIFEEMLSGMAADVAALNYRGRLYAKAQIALDRREYEEAIRCAGRILKLLPGKALDSSVCDDELQLQNRPGSGSVADGARLQQQNQTGQPVEPHDGISHEEQKPDEPHDGINRETLQQDAPFGEISFDELQMKNNAGRILTEAYTAMLREDEILPLAREVMEQGRELKTRQPSIHTEHALLTSALLLARVLYRKASFDEAFAVCQEAEESCGRLVAQGYSYLAAREELAYIQSRICYERGEYEKASAYCKMAKDIRHQRGQWKNSQDMLLDYGIEILEADLMLKDGKYGYVRALRLFPDQAGDYLHSAKTIHQYNKGNGENFDCAWLDAVRAYGLMRRADVLRLSGQTQAWESGVDVVNGALVFAEPESGGEREYCAAYLCCRKWYGQFPRIGRLMRQVFERMRELCGSISGERLIWTAAELSCGIAAEGTELFSWEQEFFRELLAKHDMSAIGNADFWRGMAYSLDLSPAGTAQKEHPVSAAPQECPAGTASQERPAGALTEERQDDRIPDETTIIETVREENRAGIGEACFLVADFARARQWLVQTAGVRERLSSFAQQSSEFTTAESDPAASAWRTYVLTEGELGLLKGEVPAESREQLEELLQVLTGSKGNVREVCQRAACHELLAAMAEGGDQTEHIREVFAAKHPFAGQYHERQILRMLRRHASAFTTFVHSCEKASGRDETNMVDTDTVCAYDWEEVLRMAEDLTTAAENGAGNGYYADAEEEVQTLVLLGRVTASWLGGPCEESAVQAGQKGNRGQSDRAAENGREEQARQSEGAVENGQKEQARQSESFVQEKEAELTGRCQSRLWELLSGDAALWEQSRGTVEEQDISRLAAWWIREREAELPDELPEDAESLQSGWGFLETLSLELYKRTGDRSRIAACLRACREYLTKKSLANRYRLARPEQERFLNVPGRLAKRVWGLFYTLIAELAEDGEQAAFWAAAAMEELRAGTFDDGVAEGVLLEAGSFLGERYPQYQEEIREIWTGREERRLQRFLAALRGSIGTLIQKDVRS